MEVYVSVIVLAALLMISIMIQCLLRYSWQTYLQKIRTLKRSPSIILLDIPRSSSPCPICLEEPMAHPVVTQCNHRYCKQCIIDWARTRTDPKCPLCNAYFRPRPRLNLDVPILALPPILGGMSFAGAENDVVWVGASGMLANTGAATTGAAADSRFNSL